MAWVEQVGDRAWCVRCRKRHHSVVVGIPVADGGGGISRRTWRLIGAAVCGSGAAVPVGDWADRWVETLEVEPRTEENYRGRLRNHILPQWGAKGLGEITASEVTNWFKQLRRRYAASTVAGIRAFARQARLRQAQRTGSAAIRER